MLLKRERGAGILTRLRAFSSSDVAAGYFGGVGSEGRPWPATGIAGARFGAGAANVNAERTL